MISLLVNILAPYPGKGWRVAATGIVDKLEHEDLWALNLDMGNWNNETRHDLKNYEDSGECYPPRLNNLLQWQNQNITEIFTSRYSSNRSCHWPSSHSFAILANCMFFFLFCKAWGLLYNPVPELFHCLGFFLVISCTTDVALLDITNIFTIWSMFSWIWRISQGICTNQGWKIILNE